MKPVFPLIAVLVIAVVLAPACGSDDRPNVLILVMDCVRGDRVSVNGYERPTTPGLEEIAEEGVTFRDAWSPGGWTGPTHSSLLTGIRPEKHGFLIENRNFLLPESVTLAEILAGEGYRTVCVTNNSWLSEKTGLTQGFDRVESLSDRRGETYPTCRWAHREVLRTAVAARDDGEPFFILVNDMEAHEPYKPWPPYQERFLRGRPTARQVEAAREFNHTDMMDHLLGLRRVAPELVPILNDLYDAEIAGLDHEIKLLVDSLDREGILDDTLLVITADHGENIGDHDLFSHKVSLHRTVCHVPLVVRLPGLLDGGRVVDDVVRLEDVFPTVLTACGVPVPAGIDGKSLTGDLAGRVAHGAYGREGGNMPFTGVPPGADISKFTVSIRSEYDGHIHRIRYSDGREEVYDVKADPEERRCLAQ